MTDITYRFLPWVRAGLAAQLPPPDTLGAGVPGRARLDVDVTVTRRTGPAIPVTRGIQVSGPGDVIGIDRRQVIRTDPKPNAGDFEPNFLAIVEFDRPDFPWMFTPAAANAQHRLRPWLVLVVLPAEQATLDTGDPLPVLTVPSAARPSQQLPNLAESWAWAHGQVMTAGAERLEDVLAGRPERTASRLICPRRLDPDTSYLACVVPAFEAGRRAGVGLDPESADEFSLRPAWTAGSDAEVKLPVYFSWRFATGQGGDFESLARALRPRPIPPEVGRHDVYVGAAGAPLPALPPDDPSAVVALRGALIPPNQPAPPWPPTTRAQVQDGLRALLDVPAQRLGIGSQPQADPAVAPPLYGRWLAAQPNVPPPAGGPRWLRTLNLDPRNRAVAGLATRVVQHGQERLMDQAWAQVGEIERANRELRWAQVAVEVRASLVRRHAAPLPAGALLQITQTAHRRMLTGPTTLWARARASSLPEESLTAAFRRAVRPRGPLARRVFAPNDRVAHPVIEGLDAGTVAAAPPDREPDGLFGFVTTTPGRTGVGADVRALIRDAASVGTTRPPSVVTATQVRAVPDSDVTIRDVTDRLLDEVAPLVATPTAQPTRGPAPITLPSRLPPVPAPDIFARARNVVLTFQETTALTIEHADRIVVTTARPVRPRLAVTTVRLQVLARLDPLTTVLARVDGRITIPPRIRPVPPRHPLDEVLATPLFPRPAWELLRDLFPEHLLPGLEHVPANTVSLMQTNQPFVESFLVGLNHEMARELLWREYPTDQRGTGFRRFWAPSGTDDIPPIHAWSKASELGSTMHGGPDGHLVLLVRGDLLRRYPSTVIYAAPDENGRPKLDDAAIQRPLFRGRMDPDVTFVGFDLTPDEARTRWWFVFEEQPTEPRFALDVADRFGSAAGPLNQWNDLTWGHLAAGPAELTALTHIPVTVFTPAQPAAPAPRWGSSASAMAAILAQQPVRVSMRGADLLAAR